jgi:uncharacterized protein YutE (UPF0331/DUF86 family)
MNLRTFIDSLELDWNTMLMGMGGDFTFSCEFDIAPEEFIGFARMDVVQEEKHGLVNAMSNAKRAIECQADFTLKCLSGKKGRDVPHKLELLRQLGVVAPSILRKVSSIRNYLEHEYKLPDRATVEEAVDIAELFVAACSKPLRAFPEDMLISAGGGGPWQLEDGLYIMFDLGDPLFALRRFKDGGVVSELVVTPQDWVEYCTIMKLALSANPFKSQKESVQAFIGSVHK